MVSESPARAKVLSVTGDDEHLNELASPTDFAAILMGMPQPYLVLDTDLVIVGASDAYLDLTQRTRTDIVGQYSRGVSGEPRRSRNGGAGAA